LKIWITPLASVAMLEKLALLKIALCRALALTIDSSVWRWVALSEICGAGLAMAGFVFEIPMGLPNSSERAREAAGSYGPSRRLV
jgi:hypothetical protein